MKRTTIIQGHGAIRMNNAIRSIDTGKVKEINLTSDAVAIWTKQINKIDTMISRLRAIIMRTPVGATGLLADLSAEITNLQDKRVPLILAEMRVRHGWDGQAYRVLAGVKVSEETCDFMETLSIKALSAAKAGEMLRKVLSEICVKGEQDA